MRADWASHYGDWEQWEVDQEEAEQREAAAVAVERDAERSATRAAAAAAAMPVDRSAERAVMEMGTLEKQALCRGFNAEGAAFFREGLCVVRCCARALQQQLTPQFQLNDWILHFLMQVRAVSDQV